MNYLQELKGILQTAEVPPILQNRNRYFGFDTAQTPGLFDVKVLYMKVSGCPTDETPELLHVSFPPRSIVTALEVNGGRISPSEGALLTLRRDRVNTESVEVTYVSTDHLRLLGSVTFEVNDRDEVLVSGVIEKSERAPDAPQAVEGFESESKTGWNVDCNCVVGSAGCVFLRGRSDLGAPPSAFEICVVGHYLGSPLILTQTVQLTARRRLSRNLTLDAIPEDDENNTTVVKPLDSEECEEIAEEGRPKMGFYVPEGMAHIEHDDGEMTWFNAGVRVGVGIGLGMCLGIGIGVGLLIRTYQATTRTFRRRLF